MTPKTGSCSFISIRQLVGVKCKTENIIRSSMNDRPRYTMLRIISIDAR
uniref:Uncharacterized protein n=1 Tax=Lepeophtheirus salmonis TaxID=72036 RepID=A0A0K2T5N7_LEPSM